MNTGLYSEKDNTNAAGETMEQILTNLCVNRLRESTEPKRDVVAETESDRGRIIHSKSFQRLQQKAQVFSLESNAAVRTRLTHSLEVAHNGRYLADKISSLLSEKYGGDKFDAKNRLAFINSVENACLIHDIGNPPFGHFGEAAICDWFSNNEGGKKIVRSNYSEDCDEYFNLEYRDFTSFDGNPQGFRVVSKLQGDDNYGMNLTYSTLASFFKYVAPDVNSNTLDASRFKKPGWFSTENESARRIFEQLDLHGGKRFCLSYLMEVADDTSYVLSDIEDGIEKQCLTEDEFFHKLEMLCSEKSCVANLLGSFKLDDGSSPVAKFIKFRTKVTNAIIEKAAEEFMCNLEEYISGTAEPILKTDCPEFFLLNNIRKVVIDNVFTSRAAEAVELSGYNMIHGLLIKFKKILELTTEDFSDLINNERVKSLQYESRLLNLVSRRAKETYKRSVTEEKLVGIKEWHARAHMITDFISGMTDQFALETFQLLEGIKIERY